MNLNHFIALLRSATTDEARRELYASLTSAQRSQLAGLTFERASELAGLETRTDEQTAEMALLVDAAETLANMARADQAAVSRVQRVAAAFVAPPASDLPVSANGDIDMNSQATRAIVADLEGYGLPDRQIERVGTAEYRHEFMAWLRSCASNPYGETRALTATTIDGGGVVVPAEFLAEVVQRRAASKRVAGLVRRYQTSRDELSVPKFLGGSSTAINDIVVQWPGAQGAVSEDRALEQWGNLQIRVHRGGFIIVADRAWLEDAAFDMDTWLVEQITDKYLATIEQMIVSGDGNGKPFGLTARTGTTTPAANLITAVNIGNPVSATGVMDIIGNLDGQYAENASWLWRRSVLYSQVMSLRDTAGHFLFGTMSSMDGGATMRVDSQLVGYPVVQSDFMAAAGAGNKIAYFGDFRQGYALVERIALQIEPYVDPAIQSKDQRAWYVRFRLGGDVTGDWALRCGLNT
jgi:HK97 family phage major capsid protein